MAHIEGVAVGIFFSCSPSLHSGYDLMRALICIMKPRSTGTSPSSANPFSCFALSGGAYSEAHALFYSVVHPSTSASVPCPARFTPFLVFFISFHLSYSHYGSSEKNTSCVLRIIPLYTSGQLKGASFRLSAEN